MPSSVSWTSISRVQVCGSVWPGSPGIVGRTTPSASCGCAVIRGAGRGRVYVTKSARSRLAGPGLGVVGAGTVVAVLAAAGITVTGGVAAGGSPPGARPDIRSGDMHLREHINSPSRPGSPPSVCRPRPSPPDGGPTNETNGPGLCESCNHAKQAAGWHSRIRPGRRHEMETTTPTGHTYRSRAPATWPAAPPLATTGSTS